MKILLTGAGGLLGTSILNSCGYDIYPTRLDIRNREGVGKLVKEISPDVIIHTAALTNVDYCETHKKEAWDVNVRGTRNIAEASRLVNSKMVYISTDYVFDGEQGTYLEYDRPNPINYYGETKYGGGKSRAGVMQ
ncbi:MAG: sugar nucleotide-binding protein [Candidatus Altiarchaeota archaeon]|nr:sugar nucleotide-binding protein [Candidatus Altiarchaeota archaeon]